MRGLAARRLAWMACAGASIISSRSACGPQAARGAAPGRNPLQSTRCDGRSVFLLPDRGRHPRLRLRCALCPTRSPGARPARAPGHRTCAGQKRPAYYLGLRLVHECDGSGAMNRSSARPEPGLAGRGAPAPRPCPRGGVGSRRALPALLVVPRGTGPPLGASLPAARRACFTASQFTPCAARQSAMRAAISDRLRRVRTSCGGRRCRIGQAPPAQISVAPGSLARKSARPWST